MALQEFGKVAQPRDIDMHPPRRNNKAHSFVYFHTVMDAALCLQALKVRLSVQRQRALPASGVLTSIVAELRSACAE